MSKLSEAKLSSLETELNGLTTTLIGDYFKAKLVSLRDVMAEVSTDPRLVQRNKAAVIMRMEIDRLNWVINSIRGKPDVRDMLTKKHRPKPAEPRLYDETRPLKNMSTYYDSIVGKYGKPHIYEMIKEKELWTWHEQFLDDFPNFTLELHRQIRMFLTKCTAEQRAALSVRITKMSRYVIKGVAFKEPFDDEKPKKKKKQRTSEDNLPRPRGLRDYSGM